MSIKIDRLDGIYVASCTYEERLTLKRKGFKFNGKKWVTTDDDVARVFYDYTIGNARTRLDNIERVKQELVAQSFAEDYDGNLLCPEGLSYLPFQRAGIDYALRRKDVLIGDDMGLGKAQNLDAKILTPSGWVRMGDTYVGQEIIGRDGETYHITGVFPQGKLDAYQVLFRDNTSTICGSEHLWAVKENSGNSYTLLNWQIKSLKDLLSKGLKRGTNNRWQIPLIEPIKFREKVFYIEPYVLGVLLGDGANKDCSPTFACPDADVEIANRVATLLKSDFRLRKNFDNSLARYSISRPYLNNYSEYVRELQRLGLRVTSKEKFIPNSYKNCSIKQRISLLQGLMDTDGSCSKNRTNFSTHSLQLAKDVCELVRSLGGVAILKTYDRGNKGIEYRVNCKTTFNPFSLTRKAEKWRLPSKFTSPVKYITNVEKLSEQIEMQCISVSAPDKLYITDDYIVTHNTVQALGLINNLPETNKILMVVPASLKLNWRRESEKWLIRDLSIGIPYTKSRTFIDTDGTKKSKTEYFWPDTEIVIINYEQLETYRDKIHCHEWDILICDEAHVLKNSKSNKCKQVFGYKGKKRSENLEPIKAKKRIFLTGTPILNKPIDLYMMASECAPETFGSYKKYVDRYCDAYETNWGLDVTGASNLEEFQEKLRSTFMIRRMKKDVLKELPEKRRQVVVLPSDGLSRIVKKEKQVFANNLKNLAIINGEKTEEDFEEISDISISKIIEGLNERIIDFDSLDLEEYMKTHFEAIAHAREEIGLNKCKMVVEYVKMLLESTDKVVVFAVHKNVVKELKNSFPNAAVVVGGMSPEAKQGEVDRFRTNKDCHEIILNLDAGSVGYTLVEANHLVMAELGFVPPILEQAEDRIYRIGQKNAANIHYLVVDGSVEASLMDIFVEKLEIIDKALNKQEKAND